MINFLLMIETIQQNYTITWLNHLKGSLFPLLYSNDLFICQMFKLGFHTI